MAVVAVAWKCHNEFVHRLAGVIASLLVVGILSGCTASSPHSSTRTTGPGCCSARPTTTSTVVPALQTHNPKVAVTPSTNLTNGEMVEVEVTGFGVGGKFFLSECASAADANDEGCGPQLAAQPFGVTNNSGAGSYGFTVTSMAPTSPYNTSSTLPCTDQCVIVATVGIDYGYAYAPVTFASS